jgi:4-hydroxy-tetrahydrodipicolinate synthase
MITPFTPDGNLDIAAAARIAEHIASAGASLFILGTTGEGTSIHPKMRRQLVETAVKHNVKGSLIYANISDNCLDVSIEYACQYAELGIDMVVAHLPSYFPLSEKEMAQYFLTLANNIPVPLIMYNMPLTIKMSVPCHVIDQLSQHSNIAGIKDSENNLSRLEESMTRWKDRKDFKHLIGCTVLSYKALSMGVDGIVPSQGNLVPSLYCRMCDAIQNGDLKQAEQMQIYSDEITDMFYKGRPLYESLPILKAMMHAYDFCDPYVLPPLLTVTDQKLNTIKIQLSTLKSMLDQL